MLKCYFCCSVGRRDLIDADAWRLIDGVDYGLCDVSGLQGRVLSLRVVFSCARVRTLRKLRSHESGLDRDHLIPFVCTSILSPSATAVRACLGQRRRSRRPGDAPPGGLETRITSRSAAEHVTEGGAGRVEHPENVDLEHRAPAFGVRFRDGPVEPGPALATRISTVPKPATAREMSASQAAGSVTSVGTASAPSPSSAARLFRRSSRRAASTTLQFCRASSRAVASPMPLEAPVTTAVLPARSRFLLERFELFEADDVAAEALRGGGAEVAYELRRLLGRAEHPEISVALEHAVELFAD